MDNDLISRSALKKAFEDTVCIEPMPYAFVKQIIDNAPTVKKKDQRGEWMVKGQDIYCSVCNQESAFNEFGASKFSNFCPNCGADMREVNNG